MSEEKNRGLGLNELNSHKIKSLQNGKDHLFIIAIDDYKDFSTLENCTRDAKDFLDLMTSQYQFEKKDVIAFLKNEEATRTAIYQYFDLLRKTVKKEDNVIIFFSGHGSTDLSVHQGLSNCQTGFWIPVDAQKGKPAGFISTLEIQRLLSYINCHHLVLIVDACFGGTIFKKLRGIDLLQAELRQSRWEITASSYNEAAYDGHAGQHSPFTGALLKILRENDQKIGVIELADKVNQVVQQETEDAQSVVSEPLNIKGHQQGQFFFYPQNRSSDNLNLVEQSQLPIYTKSKNLKPIRVVYLSILLILSTLFNQQNQYEDTQTSRLEIFSFSTSSCFAPSLLDLTEKEAIKKLDEAAKGYKVKKIEGERRDTLVVDQYPKAYAKLDSCSQKIQLTIMIPKKPNPDTKRKIPHQKYLMAGQVIDEDSQAPLKGVWIHFGHQQYKTDENGAFYFFLAEMPSTRRVNLRFIKKGYESQNYYFTIPKKDIYIQLSKKNN